MNWFLKLFHTHDFEYVYGSMKPTHKMALDWALNLRPEYEGIERCRCGEEKVIKFISYADKPR